VFNQVVTDLLNRWDQILDANRVKSFSDSNQRVLDQLEKELYSWSIECKLYIKMLDNLFI